MNKMVKLFVMLALLASGASKAGEAGLCKPLCDQEKRQCRSAAANMDDHNGESLMAPHGHNSTARYFGDGTVKTSVPAGPDVRNAQNRRMTRSAACEEQFKTCSRTCSADAARSTTSDVLVKPAR